MGALIMFGFVSAIAIAGLIVDKVTKGKWFEE